MARAVVPLADAAALAAAFGTPAEEAEVLDPLEWSPEDEEGEAEEEECGGATSASPPAWRGSFGSRASQPCP